MSKEYLEEMRKLERQQNDLTSQYDTDEENLNLNDFQKLTNSNIRYAPNEGETWKQYAIRLAIYCELSSEKSRKTHIDGPRKSWWTHRSAQGCFMCEDMNLIHMQLRTITAMANQYPNNKF